MTRPMIVDAEWHDVPQTWRQVLTLAVRRIPAWVLVVAAVYAAMLTLIGIANPAELLNTKTHVVMIGIIGAVAALAWWPES